jgi:hypothetical protein
MPDINAEIELLERRASECSLIADLASDTRVRAANDALASKYQKLLEDLRSFRHKEAAKTSGIGAHCLPRAPEAKRQAPEP